MNFVTRTGARKRNDGQIEGQTEDKKEELLSNLNSDLFSKNLNSIISNTLFRSEILELSVHGHRKFRHGSNTDLLQGLLTIQKKLSETSRETLREITLHGI